MIAIESSYLDQSIPFTLFIASYLNYIAKLYSLAPVFTEIIMFITEGKEMLSIPTLIVHHL